MTNAIIRPPDPAAETRRARRLALLMSAAIAVTIVVLTLLPDNPGVQGWDWFEHFAAFALLILPGVMLLSGSFRWLLAAVIAFGGLLELTQPVFGRQASWSDFGADALGACTGLALGLVARHLLDRRSRRVRGKLPARPGRAGR